jgi:ribonuclease VapC
MVVDTSIIIAIILQEPDADLFLTKLARATSRRFSVVSYVEACMVLTSRRGKDVEAELDLMLRQSGIEVVPVTFEQAKLASAAFRQYGKGRHPAALNFGDCFSYALAKSSVEPLLFKGSDFARTDIKIA